MLSVSMEMLEAIKVGRSASSTQFLQLKPKLAESKEKRKENQERRLLLFTTQGECVSWLSYFCFLLFMHDCVAS